MDEAMIHKKIMLLQLCQWMLLFLSAWSPTGHAKYSSPPEVVIPVKVTETSRDNRSSQLSYILRVEGERHIITMRPKKNLISRNFFLFTYTDQGDLLAENPFVKTDCYYHGYVDEDPESTVIINTCFGSLQGILEINGTVYEIMPNSSSSTFEHLVYKMGSEEPESFPMECGLTEEEIARQMKLQESIDSTLMQIPYKNWWTHRKHIEYYVVVDKNRYIYNKNNVTICMEEMIEIVNGINGLYVQIDTDVVLVAVEVWTNTNAVNVSEEITRVLPNFCNWKTQNTGNRNKHDIIHLFARQGYGKYLGLAYVGAVCTHLDCAVNSFMTNSLPDMAIIIAHEMGHNLGMHHDDKGCTCGERFCIMYPSKTSATKFSNCSYEKMFTVTMRTTCLYNTPETRLRSKKTICGNNVVEEGEQCDCGSTAACNSDPCCGDDCFFTPGFECASGLCCKDCKFRPTGTLCRKQKNECDLPEWCNGTSSQCPGDVYKEDGHPCKGGGYCYKMECNDLGGHCQKIFGKGARSAEETCYMEMNRRGDRFGNCGNNTNSYKRCDILDIFCGRIQCENVMEIPRRRNHETVHWTHFKNVTCWTMDYHFGITIDDSAAVKDGTVCGPNRVCIDRKCVSDAVLASDCSTRQCNRKGVCNNKKHCHCNAKWEPPNCIRRGFGGSVDSGPPPKKQKGFFNWASSTLLLIIIFVIMLLIFLGIITMRESSDKKNKRRGRGRDRTKGRGRGRGRTW